MTQNNLLVQEIVDISLEIAQAASVAVPEHVQHDRHNQLHSQPPQPLTPQTSVPLIANNNDGENVRQRLSGLQLQPIPLESERTPEAPGRPAVPRRQVNRVSIPWELQGVKELSLQVMFTIRYWDCEARKTMVIMQSRQRGIRLFVDNMSMQLGITLTKNPVFQTIENGAKKTLTEQKAKRNKEKNKVTGDGDRDGDELLSQEEFAERQRRENFTT